MKNIGMMVLTVALSFGVVAGCTEAKKPAETPQEAATPAEVKEAVPAATTAAPAVDEAAVKEAAPAAPAVEKAATEPQASGTDLVAGTVIFRTKCVACHGADGRGTAMAPAFKGNDWIKKTADGEIAKVIKDGRAGAAKRYKNFPVAMPAQKTMSDGDINAVIDYIRSIN